ncbi:putative secondary metabolism biosyntheticenzyme [Clathrus columnatus]|uniref:Secondary metabolism biosyntheticenzyme n=1 Tax=Clathrus columnatus TaxID=1419009 RepID=A0AAV5A0K3_9AGAM|nr:putative secondary metabolism biosyntheticenzyme [Clathrus columnatus]
MLVSSTSDIEIPFTQRDSFEFLSLDQVYNWRKVHSPDLATFAFQDDENKKSLGIAVDRCVAFIRLHTPQLTIDGSKEPCVVGILSTAAAIAHLIRLKKVKHLWTTDGPMFNLAKEAVSLVEGGPTIIICPTYNQLYSPEIFECTSNDVDFTPFCLNLPAVILHSSENGGLDFSNDTFALHSIPLFHMMGITYIAGAAMLGGYVRAVPSPHKPILPWTPERYLEHIINSEATVAIAVPSFLEAWIKDTNAIEALKKLRLILWGGGPLHVSTGRYLIEKGVNIVNGYGTTEIGIVTTIVDKPYTEGHEWFTLSPHSLTLSESDSVFELVVMESETQHLAVHNTKVNSTPAYATNDLLERHPDNPSLLRIIGRKDDQIMLSTGEKTNAGPMEQIIMQHSLVKCAMMFGRGKVFNGVLIEPVSHAEFESHGEEIFRDMIWPAIQEANDYGPAHSRIPKNMIIFSSPSKPFELTAKNTPRRSLIMAMYEDEIDHHYDVLDYVTNGRSSIKDDDDFFSEIGCDSLQALHIRNAVVRLIAQTGRKVDLEELPQNFVYQYPTIKSLASFIWDICASGTSEKPRSLNVEDFEAAHATQLQNYVSKYTRNWKLQQPEGEVFLLTGSTGSLGSELLAQLIQLPSVSRIYVFNRPSKKTALERHILAFEDSGNNPWLLHSEKITYLHGDLTKEGFDVEPALFEEMLTKVTTIIHNAWQVDFNLALSSFEPMICGVRKLIDFALSSKMNKPPKFIFISSLRAWTASSTVPEAPLNDTKLVNIIGYGESKWVAEQILDRAAQETDLCPLIIRVGQLSGGKEGKWNPKEWLPTLVRTSKKINGLPDNNSMVSFLPTHVAASAIIELRKIPNRFVHLVHPRPIHWHEMINHISEYLNLPIIPYSEWFERVESLSTLNNKSTSAVENPAIHLLETFRYLEPIGDVAMDPPFEREILGLPFYDTTIAVANAASLQTENLKQLGKDDIKGWLIYWQKPGVL